MASTNITSLMRRGAYDAQVETVTAGALSTSKRISKLSVTGTQAYTLAAGRWIGQEKLLICSVAATSPVGTLTLAVLGGTTIGAFGVVNEQVRLVWDGAAWLAFSLSGVTVS
jgi:hypothetical protein